MDGFSLLQFETLEGLMLGDGHIPKGAKNGNSYLYVERSGKDIEYLKYQADIFSEYLGASGIVKRERYDARTNNTYTQVRFVTRQNFLFGIARNRWYKDGIKTVPKDICLTPTVVGTWIADDGFIKPYNGKKYKSIIEIKLSTNGFCDNDVLFLAKLLEETYSIKCYTYRDAPNRKGLCIKCTRSGDIYKLLRDIDFAFPKGMERKSNIWRVGSRVNFIHKVNCCTFCNSENYCKDGTSNGKQKFLCKKCGTQFLQI